MITNMLKKATFYCNDTGATTCSSRSSSRHPIDARACVALQVLSNRALFRATTSFMAGFTRDIIEFAQRVAPQHRRNIAYQSLVAWNATDLIGSEVVAGIEDSRLVLSLHGMLPYLAIKEDNLTILTALLAAQPSANEQLAFVHTAARAVQYGRLAILQWLYMRHVRTPTLVPWDDDLLRLAIRYRRVDILEWLAIHFPHALATAKATGVQHIHWRACTGNLAVLQWLDARSFAFTTRVMDEAAAHGHLLDVAFLHEQRTEGCTPAAIDRAAQHGHADVVAFLGRSRIEGCAPATLVRVARQQQTQHSAVGATAVAVVHALCTYTTAGCLFDARLAAVTAQRLDVVAALDQYIAPHITTCTLAMHAPKGPRRCQALTTVYGCRNG